MATLKDVAARTGLTVTTVSRVLNNRGYISEDTREKVHAAMRELNYQPNEVARSLSRKTSNTIGVIVPHIRHPYFAEMISNIENTASEQGYKMILFNSQGKDHKEKQYLDMCTSNRVDGIILFSAGIALKEFAGSNIPLITVERFAENGTASVECDNRQGGQLAAEHLISCGCKSLLHVSGIADIPMPADDRAKGFVEVCEKNHIPCRQIATSLGQYNSLDYHKMLEEILTGDGTIDGIFASSDLIAAQILQVCTALNRKVPEDIKLIGFDDVNIAQLTSPAITTIHQPIREMANYAVDLLIRASRGEVVAKRTLLPVSLVKREST